MNKIKTWFAENKGASVFSGAFLLLTGAAGWFASSSWDDFSNANQAYADVRAKLSTMAKQTPYPSEANLTQLQKAIISEQSSLNELLVVLRRYSIPVFPGMEKTQPQDAPHLLQDAIRAQVTKLKTQTASVGSILPSGFYLGLEEYENRLPSIDDAPSIARQLTVFNWITEHLISHPGLIVAEFSKAVPSPSPTVKVDRKPQAASPKTDVPYENLAIVRISFRCDQGSLRDILNVFSKSPYFLVIDSLQLQNTVTEPPKRDSSSQQQAPQPATNPVGDAQPSVQRIPVIVGHEQINVSLRVRILEFPEKRQTPTATSK